MSDATPADFTRDLVRWSETLAGIARTGMGFTESLYERERYEEILHVAADIKAAADEALEVRREQDHFVQEWMESIGEGVPGYVTPKVAVGAIVGDDEGRILLVKRPDSGVWLYPTGWADVGYSPSEVAIKEVHEETGVECEPVRLIGVVDGQRMGFREPSGGGPWPSRPSTEPPDRQRSTRLDRTCGEPATDPVSVVALSSEETLDLLHQCRAVEFVGDR